jgi:hypothetical protein
MGQTSPASTWPKDPAGSGDGFPQAYGGRLAPILRPGDARRMPAPPQPDPVQIVTRFGGVVHRQDLISLCGRGPVDAAVAEGRLHKPGRSWIRLTDRAEDVYAARVARGVVGGLSAALHHNWAVKTPPRETEIIVPANRGQLGPGHRRRVLAAGSARDGVLTPEATVVDCALAHDVDAALSVADSALRSRRVSTRAPV